jgi:hypothetical protein
VKIQLFWLTLVSALSVVAPTQAQSINNTTFAPNLQVQFNRAIGMNGFTQGGSQLSNISIGQSSIVTPPSMPSFSPHPQISAPNISLTNYNSPPNVIINTIVAPTIQIQGNIAVLSNNGIQGGTQDAKTNTAQNVLVTGTEGNNNTYIYNTNYSPVYQYQINYAAYSKNIIQGGATSTTNNSLQDVVVGK